jgi:diguanylate cyclase (GGDEF)-like protein
MVRSLLFPVLAGTAISLIGLAGGLHWIIYSHDSHGDSLGLVLTVSGVLVGLAVAYLLHSNIRLRHDIATKAGELEARLSDLQIERSALEDAASEKIALAEDLFLAREKSEHTAKFLEMVMDNICHAIAVFGPDDTLVEWNRQLGEILDIPDHLLREGLPRDVFRQIVRDQRLDVEVIPHTDEDHHRAERDYTLLSTEEWTLRNGRVLLVRHTRLPGGGSIRSLVDITSRKKDEEEIWRMAHHDQLTDLANRTLFEEALDGLTSGENEITRAALAIIDLDRFKQVNDTFGHPVGDKLLVTIAGILKSHISDDDLAVRLGGDEFAILFTDPAALADVEALSRRIIADIMQPMVIDGHQIEVGASIGIAFFPDHGRTASALMSRADAALYEVKGNGRGDVAVARTAPGAPLPVARTA